MNSQVILVGGGTGFIGRHLVNALRCSPKNKSEKLLLITRQAEKYPQSLTWDKIKNQGFPENTSVVINLAGKNVLEAPLWWTEATRRECYASRIGTNRMLADAINKSVEKPKAFITISGVGFYDTRDDDFVFDENWTSTEAPKCYPSSLARDWEAASALNEESRQKTRSVVIRAGVVLGSDSQIIQNTKLPAKLGFLGTLGTGKQWFPWIHVKDLVNMFMLAINDESIKGVINGVAPEQVTNKQFTDTLNSLNNRKTFLPMPASVVKILYGHERSTFLLEGMKVSSRAESLGFKYEFPTLKSALADSLTNKKQASS